MSNIVRDSDVVELTQAPGHVAGDVEQDDGILVGHLLEEMVERGGLLLRVANGDQVHVIAGQKAAVGLRIFVHTDSHNRQIGPLVVQFD